jgi:hypothetical protein
MQGIHAAKPARRYSPMAPAMAGAMDKKYTGVRRCWASLKPRAMAPMATKIAEKRNAVGRITQAAAAARVQGTDKVEPGSARCST